VSNTAKQVVLSRTNTSDSTLYLWVEPWAEEYEIRPKGHVEVTMRGSAASDPEIDEMPDRITIYAPGNAFFDIRIDGMIEKAVSSEIAAPDAVGLGTRGFVDLVFGAVPGTRPGGIPAPPKVPTWRRWLSKLFRS